MTMFPCEFAIVPDGKVQPAAVFQDLEDAIEWGLERLGDNRFSIRYVLLLQAPKGQQ